MDLVPGTPGDGPFPVQLGPRVDFSVPAGQEQKN